MTIREPLDGDPIAAANAEIVRRMLEQAAADDAWDVAPEAAAYFRADLGPNMLAISPVRLPLDKPFRMAQPPQVLHAAAEAVRARVLPMPSDADVVAVGVIVETWMLSSHDPERAAEHHAFTSAGGQIVDHPDRIEAKGMLMVDTAGYRFYGLLVRGTTEPEITTSAPGDDKLGGRLVDALEDLLAALVEVARVE